MGMPITVEIPGSDAREEFFAKVFAYFTHIDETFSTYKKTSEISAINEGILSEDAWSDEMKEVFELSEQTKKETRGYFDIKTPAGSLDPSGLVKGWAIFNAAEILKTAGIEDFYIDAGGDIQPHGKNAEGKPWSVGIKNPFAQGEIVKVLYLSGEGVATSGSYIRGSHIYNPLDAKNPASEVVSLTVVGPNVYEADRFATAAFAMGRYGVSFIEGLPGFEAYSIDAAKVATMTSGFAAYTHA